MTSNPNLIAKSAFEDAKLLKLFDILLTGEQSGQNLHDLYPHMRNYLGEMSK